SLVFGGADLEPLPAQPCRRHVTSSIRVRPMYGQYSTSASPRCSEDGRPLDRVALQGSIQGGRRALIIESTGHHRQRGPGMRHRGGHEVKVLVTQFGFHAVTPPSSMNTDPTHRPCRPPAT